MSRRTARDDNRLFKLALFLENYGDVIGCVGDAPDVAFAFELREALAVERLRPRCFALLANRLPDVDERVADQHVMPSVACSGQGFLKQGHRLINVARPKCFHGQQGRRAGRFRGVT